MVIQQIVELASVNLVHRNSDRKVSLVILEVSYAAIEQIMDC
jgi:hypothetical protein